SLDHSNRAGPDFMAFAPHELYHFRVPELGTIKAIVIPRVVLTSNGTRELSDALRRRCLYHYVDFPDVDREAKIILTRLPGFDAALARQGARMVGAGRRGDLRKPPGAAEPLDGAPTPAGPAAHARGREPGAVHEPVLSLQKPNKDRPRLTREVTDRLLSK